MSTTPAPRRGRRNLTLILGCVLAGLALLLGVVAIVGLTTDADTPAAGGAAPSSPATSAPAKLAPKTVPSIDDGVWTVGEDVPAGTYKVTAALAAGAGCYWKISTSGTNGRDIVDNALPKGGLPRVTLAAGQDFETKRCGTWRKQ